MHRSEKRDLKREVLDVHGLSEAIQGKLRGIFTVGRHYRNIARHVAEDVEKSGDRDAPENS